MKSNLKIMGKGLRLLLSSLLLLVLTACAPLREAESLLEGQENHRRLLEQQSGRLRMQEELLSLLTDSQRELARTQRELATVQRQLSTSQQELAATMAGLEERTLQIQGALTLAVENDEREEAEEEEEDASEGLDAALEAAEKEVLGRVEWVWLELLERNFKARIDTGALSSSLSAFDLQPFERDGREWVRFRVPDEEHPEGGALHEAPLVKHVRIRQSSSDTLDRRPVVRLTVRVGELVDEAEFNLTDRRDMIYSVLLGRNFLRDVALVDAARKFTAEKHRPSESEAGKGEETDADDSGE